MTHTPGPWHQGWGKVIDEQGKAICMLTPRSGAHNGSLLAAAPDLLVALKQCIPLIAAHANAALGEGVLTLQVARAAIDKAEGRAT